MGSFVSVLLAPLVRLFGWMAGEAEPEDQGPSLSQLLEQLASPADGEEGDVAAIWTRICRRLGRYPEEAACYCHSVDPSPLQQCLTNTPRSVSIPVEVIRAFLNAYEDAVHCSDRHGVTPLLAAAKRTSVAVGESAVPEDSDGEVMQLLLRANPYAAHQTDKRGRLPLHYVRSDVETARRILQAHPSAAAQEDRDGRLPLHYYCELIRSDRESNTMLTLPHPKIAQMLLEKVTTATSPVLLPDKNGKTPLDLYYHSLEKLLKEKASGTCHLDALWDVLTVLVKSACPAPTTPMVHALVSLHCPLVVLQESLRRYPNQTVERDAKGCTPLALAVNRLDQSSCPETQAVVCHLLQANSRAARMTDLEGRLAIDVLCEKGAAYSPELYDLMVQAEPRALCTRDLKNKQHPFLTAAMAGNASGVYHLLRAKPHVIRYFLNEC